MGELENREHSCASLNPVFSTKLVLKKPEAAVKTSFPITGLSRSRAIAVTPAFKYTSESMMGLKCYEIDRTRVTG